MDVTSPSAWERRAGGLLFGTGFSGWASGEIAPASQAGTRPRFGRVKPRFGAADLEILCSVRGMLQEALLLGSLADLAK